MDRNRWRFVLTSLTTVGLLWLLGRHADLDALAIRIGTADLVWLSGAALLFLSSYVIQAFRWTMTLRAWGRHQRVSSLLRIVLIGNFATLLLPTAAGGDVARWTLLARRQGDRSVPAQTVAADRLLGLGALGALMLVALPSAWPFLPGGNWRWAALSIVPVTLCALVGVLDPRWVPTAIRRRLSISRARHTTWMWSAAATAVLNQLVAVAAVVAIARSVGDPTSLRLFIALVPAVWLASMIPVSLGGVGVRETAFVVLFSAAGLDTTVATTIAALWLTLALAFGALGGLLLLGEGQPPLGNGATRVAAGTRH